MLSQVRATLIVDNRALNVEVEVVMQSTLDGINWRNPMAALATVNRLSGLDKLGSVTAIGGEGGDQGGGTEGGATDGGGSEGACEDVVVAQECQDLCLEKGEGRNSIKSCSWQSLPIGCEVTATCVECRNPAGGGPPISVFEEAAMRTQNNAYGTRY